MKKLFFCMLLAGLVVQACGGGSNEAGSTSGALDLEYAKKLVGYPVPGYTWEPTQDKINGDNFFINSSYVPESKDTSASALSLNKVEVYFKDRKAEKMVHDLKEFKLERKKDIAADRQTDFEQMEVGGHIVYLRTMAPREPRETKNYIRALAMVNENGYCLEFSFNEDFEGTDVSKGMEKVRATAKLFVESMPKP